MDREDNKYLLKILKLKNYGEMMVCTFFGHRDAPSTLQPEIKKLLIDLIERGGVDAFFVGDKGNFDRMVLKTLRQLKKDYSHIRYCLVLAYLPTDNDKYEGFDFSEFIYPEGIEHTPKKYAIVSRNKWMIDKSDVVVTYIKQNQSNASRFKDIASKKGKIIINL